MKIKKIAKISRGTGTHWVGDGFPVNTLISYHTQGEDISPFLLLDYAGPAEFEPSDRPRGVGQHPHRGFETVTIVYQGEVEHKDNAGNAGKIGPGDVQWMTAARGILHEEMHGRDFTKEGRHIRDDPALGQFACQRQNDRTPLSGNSEQGYSGGEAG